MQDFQPNLDDKAGLNLMSMSQSPILAKQGNQMDKNIQ